MDLTKINELISEKKFEDAKSELEELLKQDEQNIDALKLLGLCNVNLGLFGEGRFNFETVVKYKADDATSWFYLANCYDNLDDFLHAKTAYLEVLKLRENYVDAYKNLCVIYMKTHEEKKAIEIGKKAMELEEEQNDYVMPYLVGTAYLAIKDFVGSVPYLEKALELKPDHAQILNNLGTAYLTTGNYEKAYEYYQKSSELDPRNSITFYNIASILQIQNKHKEACEYFKKAYDLEDQEYYLVALSLSQFKAGLYEEAIENYKKLIEMHPEKSNFQYNLACCYEMMGELNFSIGILAQLVMVNPKSIIMSQKLANLYLRTNQPLKAKEIYKQMLTRGMVSPEIYYEYALICVATGDSDMAEKILKKVVSLNPEFALAHKDLGVIFLNKRLFDYALDEFEKAYKLEPENLEIIFEYANYLHATSDFEKAENLYRKALEKSPLQPNVWLFNTMNLISMNKIDEAVESVEKAVQMLPEDSFALFLAGKVKYIKKDYDGAQMMLVRSVEQKQTPEAMNLLALNYLAQEDFEKASNIFISMLKDTPDNTNLLISSAKCYIGLKDFKSAKAQLKKVSKIFPESFEVKDLKEIIKNETKKLKEMPDAN